jgi:hypothetical protein
VLRVLALSSCISWCGVMVWCEYGPHGDCAGSLSLSLSLGCRRFRVTYTGMPVIGRTEGTLCGRRSALRELSDKDCLSTVQGYSTSQVEHLAERLLDSELGKDGRTTMVVLPPPKVLVSRPLLNPKP